MRFQKVNFILLFLLFFMLSTFSLAEKTYVGYWKILSGKSIIHIVKEGNSYSGYVVWLKEPTYSKGDKQAGQPKKDRFNPDTSLQGRNALGLKVAGNLVPDGTTKLKNGWVYDPFHGKKYLGTAEIIDDNTVRIRGSLDKNGIFGYTMECKRINPSKYGIK